MPNQPTQHTSPHCSAMSLNQAGHRIDAELSNIVIAPPAGMQVLPAPVGRTFPAGIGQEHPQSTVVQISSEGQTPTAPRGSSIDNALGRKPSSGGSGWRNGGSFAQKKLGPNVKVPLGAFPANVQDLLKKYDVDGDETLDVEEILEGFHALEREKNKVRYLVRTLCAAVVLTILLLAAIGGMLFIVIESSKETSVDSNVLTVKGDTVPIQTASTDFVIKDNVIQGRGGDGAVAVAQAGTKASLSSVMEDENLQELKSMTIGDGKNWIQFQVLAVARYEEVFSRWGSVVVVYTHLGELTLDDNTISFHESLENSFTRAGFTVDESGRRVLGELSIFGLFNTITYAQNEDSVRPHGLPSVFTASVTAIIECWDGIDCQNDQTGELVDWADSPSQSAEYQTVSWTEQLETHNFDGDRVARLLTSAEGFPGQQHVQAYSMTHKFSAQRFEGRDYNCQLTESGWLTEEQSATNIAGSMIYKGEVLRAGRQCRHFEVQGDDGVIVNAFEAIDTDTIFQIQTLFFTYQFDALVPLPNVEAGPVPESLDVTALMNACPTDRVAPSPAFNRENWEDAVPVDPSWGTVIPSGQRRRDREASKGADRVRTVLGLLDRVYAASYRR